MSARIFPNTCSKVQNPNRFRVIGVQSQKFEKNPIFSPPKKWFSLLRRPMVEIQNLDTERFSARVSSIIWNQVCPFRTIRAPPITILPSTIGVIFDQKQWFSSISQDCRSLHSYTLPYRLLSLFKNSKWGLLLIILIPFSSWGIALFSETIFKSIHPAVSNNEALEYT